MASPNAHPDTEAVPPPHDFASWKHPYRDADIYIHRDIVHRLSSEAVRHLKQDTEIGGILWGKMGPGGSILVLDVTPVSSSGSRFNTTAIDTRMVAQALNSPVPDPTLYRIGFFRSHVREGLRLGPQDRTLVAEHLNDPDSVILLLKPFQAGICTAGFFFWNGASLPEESELEVPFVVEDAASSPPVGAENEEESIVDLLRESAIRRRILKPAKLPHEIAARPAPPQPSAKRSPWTALAIAPLIALLIIIAAAAVLLWPTARSHLQAVLKSPPTGGIDLQAVRGPDGQFQVSWNRNSPEVLKARSGTLFITDGRFSPKLPLTREQLRSGTLIYMPRTANVRFRLALDLDGSHSIGESVRALSANPERRKRLANSRPRRDAPSSVAADSPQHDPVASSLKPPAATKAGLLAALPVPPTGSGRRNGIPAGYIPPQVIQEMMPETAPLGHFAKIAIRVSLDPQGRVTSARAEHPPANHVLTAVALSAARKWRFRPAMLNGKAVPAEYTIVFAFRPQLP